MRTVGDELSVGVWVLRAGRDCVMMSVCESGLSECSCRAANVERAATFRAIPTSTLACSARTAERNCWIYIHPGDAATAVWTFDCAVDGTDVRGPYI